MGTFKKIHFVLFFFTLNVFVANAQNPGDTIYIYDYRSIHDDGIKDPLYQSVLSYQGLVNRSGPRLLVQFNKQDYPFTDSVKAHYPEYEFVEVSTTHELFTMPELRKYCDTAFYYNEHFSLLAENCAVTYAGLEDAVMVEDAAMSAFDGYGFGIKADMRTYEPWSTVEKCSQWLLKTAREDTTANKHFYGIAEGNVGRNKAIDFMIQQKMVCFILDSHAEHVGPDHFEKYQEPYLRLYPPFSVSHGWWSKEVKDVEALSTFGHTSANQGENVSFWHQLPVKGDYLQRKSKDTLPAYDPSKTYVLFTFSQGDGMRYCQRTNFEKYVHEDANGQLVSKTTSFGLMHNTLQLEIQPFVPYFHYKQIRDNDLRVWFSGKGYGYANPTTLRENGYLKGYAERSVDFLNRMGMVDLMVNDNKIDRDNNNTVLKDFIDMLEYKPRSVLLKHELNRGDSQDDEATVINGVPVFADPVMAINTDDGDMIYDEMLDAIAASMNKRQFFYVFLKHPNNVAEVEALLGMMEEDSTFDDLVVLHPDQFIDFYRSAYGLEPYQRPTVPTQQVANLTLYQEGSMPDRLSWEPAADEAGITEYAIWFLDRDGHKIGSSLARVPQGTGSYDIDSSQSIPLGAESLGVFASWNGVDAFEAPVVDLDTLILPDTTVPVITSTHDDQILEANEMCMSSLPDYTIGAQATDPGGGDPHIYQTPPPGTHITGTVNEVTLMAMDDLGNTGSTTFNVKVEDHTDPVFNSLPNQVELEFTDGQATLPDYRDDVEVSDNCDFSPDIAQTPEPLTTLYDSVTEVTLTATDQGGNTTQVHFNVGIGVQNPNAPVITSTHSDQTLEADAQCQATLPDYTGNVEATDDQDWYTELEISQTPAPYSSVAGDTNAVTLTVTDSDGYSSEVTFHVEVVDHRKPNVVCPEDQTFDLQGSQTEYTISSTVLDPVSVDDNCMIDSIFNDYNTLSTLEGAGFQADTTTVTWTARDQAGNEDQCSVDVVVNAPVGIGGEALKRKGISVFPNPTKGKLHFDFSHNRVSRLTVSGITGRICIIKKDPGQRETLDLSTLKDGMYIIGIDMEGERFTLKIVKQ